MTRTHFGEMLVLYRAARRWTVRDIAPQMGISIATLSRIERGGAMDAETMLKIWAWLLRAALPDAGGRVSPTETHDDVTSRVAPSVPCVDGQELPRRSEREQSPLPSGRNDTRRMP